MPGLVPGIHVLLAIKTKDVNGRDKPGHDAKTIRGHANAGHHSR
jgi:hypothetical protein